MVTLHLKKSISRSPSRLVLLLFPLVVAGSLLLWGAGAEAIAATYTTNFPLTENPISEGGHWINGLTNGIDWADVATTPGRAFGTQTGIGPNFADSTALLTGSWGPTQTVQAVVYIASGDSTTFEEVELRLRSSLSAHSCTGYEVNFSVKPDNPYCQIVRWNGPLGDFTLLDARSVGVVNGDVVKATAVGSTITCYINNTAIFSVNDTTYPSGNPGMGFYLQGGLGPPFNYGFSSYTASDGTQTPTPTPTATAPNINTNAYSYVTTPTATARHSYSYSTHRLQLPRLRQRQSTATATATPTATATATATPTARPTATPTATTTPAPTVTPTATPTPTPGQITLTARGYKVRGRNTVDLSWTGATSSNVDIYRNGVLIVTTLNDRFYTDSPGGRGPATYTYRVCNAGSQTCSNQATVTVRRRVTVAVIASRTRIRRTNITPY